MKKLSKILPIIIFGSFLFINLFVLAEDGVDISAPNSSTQFNLLSLLKELIKQGQGSQKLLNYFFTLKDGNKIQNKIAKETIININNYVVSEHIMNYLSTIKDGNEHQNINPDQLIRFSNFYLDYKKSNNLDQFDEFLNDNWPLALRFLIKKDRFENNFIPSNITINENGEIFYETTDEEGNINSLNVLDMLNQLSAFLQEYEYVFDSYNPYLVLMSDEELKKYKTNVEKAIEEFSNYDFTRAHAEYRYALTQYRLGYLNNSERGKNFYLTLKNQLKEKESLNLEALLYVCRVESYMDSLKGWSKCPLFKKIADDDFGFISTVWKQYGYEPYVRRLCRIYPSNVLLLKFGEAQACRRKKRLGVKPYADDESVAKLYDKVDAMHTLCFQGPSEEIMTKKEALKILNPVSVIASEKTKDAWIEQYCQSFDLDAAMARIDAFWKVWGPLCESGQDPWSYWLSQAWQGMF